MPEFTCVCPKTGSRLRDHPHSLHTAEHCVELKSLKLYLWSYREVGSFHEAITNKIMDDLVAAISPKRMVVEGDFYVRGGIGTVVEVQHP